MRIGIDASLASIPGTGTGRYASQLLARLIELDRRNEYVLYVRRRDDTVPFLRECPPHVQVRVTDAPLTLARLHVNLPICLARDRVDLYHSLAFFTPGLWPSRTIVTIHDIHPVLLPQYWNVPGTRISYLALRAHIPWAIRRATRIVVPSEYTRQTITRRFGTPPERIAVTPYAADPFFFAPATARETEAMRRRFGSESFFLFVGALSPVKNVSGVVASFARFRQGTGRERVRLVLVGRPAGRFLESTLRPMIERLGLTHAVHVAGHVDEAMLRALYANAIALIFPSFGEGFGLPTLEAMASGTAVVASGVGALAEVTADAALHVDPHQPEEIADAMARLHAEPALRERLIASGRNRAAAFSWERTARQTLEVYEGA
jgi:glycosyltransferase involved in cell wall biosynthesis